MAAWTSDELDKIGTADELQIQSVRSDGTLRKPVTIWVVRHGDDLYVRSGYGRGSAWFRGTQERYEGHVRSGGVEKDVTFVDVEDDINDQVDTAFRTKYHRYDSSYVDALIAPEAQRAGLKLVPRAST